MSNFIEVYYSTYQANVKNLINIDKISAVWISEVSKDNYLVNVEIVTYFGDRMCAYYVGDYSLVFRKYGHFDKDIAEKLYNELKEILNS